MLGKKIKQKQKAQKEQNEVKKITIKLPSEINQVCANRNPYQAKIIKLLYENFIKHFTKEPSKELTRILVKLLDYLNKVYYEFPRKHLSDKVDEICRNWSKQGSLLVKQKILQG